MKKFLPCILFIIVSAIVAAQPTNNICTTATSVTPDGTCYSGTTVSATDTWIGTVGCQSGNNREVWYTFTATGSSLDVNITSGTLTGNVEFILVEASAPCTGLINRGSLCGASPLSGDTP